jgi:hypothetical protein
LSFGSGMSAIPDFPSRPRAGAGREIMASGTFLPSVSGRMSADAQPVSPAFG